jgi:2-methylcitrate dehydratase
MIAVPLLFGRLTAADYDDAVAADPRVDALRAKMVVTENEAFTRDYYDLSKRWIGNAIRVVFSDGSSTRRVQVDVPVGHRDRRAEGLPLLMAKFESSAAEVFPPKQLAKLLSLPTDSARFDALSVTEFMSLLVRN